MIRKLAIVIPSKYRRKMFLILSCSIFMAFLEMIGVASIAPFMAVVASPEIIQENDYLYKAYLYFNYSNSNEFLISLGGLVIILLLLNNL